LASEVKTAWRNWARNQRSNGIAFHRPDNESDLVAIVNIARKSDQRVKVVGHGHSFTDIAVTDGHIVSLENYNKILNLDTVAHQVNVQSGIRLSDLNEQLDLKGFAMPNLGDIAYQSLAGSISTSTHGTGITSTGLAAQVVGLRLITADGSILNCSVGENAELFHVARVGLGALGILSTVTLRIVPAFNLHAVEEPMRLDHLLDHLDEFVSDNDHFEFFWVPHTGWALTKRNNRTVLPADPRKRIRTWWNKTVMENYAFGTVCGIGRLIPSLIPKLAKALPSSGRTEYVNKSFKVFTSKRIVKFYEMEYAIPRANITDALNRVRAMVEIKKFKLNFPVEVRFAAADDIPLSTACGRESAYIAVHVYKGMEYEAYFREVESIMNEYEGRPHWGKLHFQTLKTLSPRYHELQRFADVRNRLDPEGVFTNDYLRRVLGK
jgi:L-gulonolactone oxidase